MTGDPCLDQTVSDQAKTEQAPQDELMEFNTDLDRAPGRNWWTDTLSQAQHTSGQHTSARPWDFSCILFPDLGSSRAGRASLAAPDPKLLPGALQVRECEVAPWLRKLNLKAERLSRREQEWQKERDRYHRDINNDREVRHCRNWAEYLELMEKRRSQRCTERPAHLWEQDVIPLTQPGQCDSHRKFCTAIFCVCAYLCLESRDNFVHSLLLNTLLHLFHPSSFTTNQL